MSSTSTEVNGKPLIDFNSQVAICSSFSMWRCCRPCIVHLRFGIWKVRVPKGIQLLISKQRDSGSQHCLIAPPYVCGQVMVTLVKMWYFRHGEEHRIYSVRSLMATPWFWLLFWERQTKQIQDFLLGGKHCSPGFTPQRISLSLSAPSN